MIIERKNVCIKMDVEIIDFFKEMAENTGIPYQTLMRACLADCAKKNKAMCKLEFEQKE